MQAALHPLHPPKGPGQSRQPHQLVRGWQQRTGCCAAWGRAQAQAHPAAQSVKLLPGSCCCLGGRPRPQVAGLQETAAVPYCCLAPSHPPSARWAGCHLLICACRCSGAALQPLPARQLRREWVHQLAPQTHHLHCRWRGRVQHPAGWACHCQTCARGARLAAQHSWCPEARRRCRLGQQSHALGPRGGQYREREKGWL